MATTIDTMQYGEPPSSTEYDPLLSPHVNEKLRSFEGIKCGTSWCWYHTLWAILIRIIGEILTKNTVVFYENFQDALGLSVIQFSYIIIANQLGAIGAMLVMPSITNWLPSLTRKISIFGFVCGLTAALFPLAAFISSNASVILLYCFVNRLMFGIAYFVYVTSVLDLASKINDETSGKQGRVIALLEVSWTIASLFYIVVGYSIEFLHWDFNFFLFGALLCLASGGSHFVFRRFDAMPQAIETLDTRGSANGNTACGVWLESMKLVLCRKQSVFLFGASFAMGVFNSSFAVVVSSLWFEDVFHLDSFRVGLIALTIFGAELCASIGISRFVDVQGVWTCACIAFSSAFAGSVVAFVLASVYGPSIGGIEIAIVLVFVLYFGWECFYIVHQIVCIQSRPSNNHTSLMILTNFVFIYTGSMVGSYVAPMLWDFGNGFGTIGAIWIACLGFASTLYFILYCRRNSRI